jgi:hypothetical protein
MEDHRLIEIIYLESGFSFNQNCPRDDSGRGRVIGEISSKEESLRISWDKKTKEIVVDRKDEKGDWQNSDFVTYHQKKIDNKDNRYSVTIGDCKGKMLFKGVFEF